MANRVGSYLLKGVLSATRTGLKYNNKHTSPTMLFILHGLSILWCIIIYCNLQKPLKRATAVTSSKEIRKKLRDTESVSEPMMVSTNASSSADGPTVSKQRKKQIKVHIFFSA